MEIQLYTDEACTIPAAEEPIVLTNVPSSIEVEAANYDVEQAKYIYKGITQSFFIDVPTDGEGREFYYKLFAYDGAKRYLPEDETPSDDDLKGNRAEYFFLQKDIYENNQQYYTITEMYSILSDNYFESSTDRAAEAPLPEQVKTDLLDDSKYQRTIGKFNLNPKNNPTYTVTGRSPLASLTKSSFENDDNALIIGGQLIIEVSPGLDGHILKEDTIKIYTQQYTFTDGTPVVGTPVEITQYERKESGNTYKYITNINREDGYEIGKFYTVYVEGKDVKNNTIVSAGNNPYGFRLISNGRAPVINLSEPEDVTTYTNKKQVFKGTAEVELGIPVVNVYKGIVSESTKVKTIEFTEEQGYKEGSDFVFDFTYEDETFDGKTGKSKFLFETDLGGQKSTQPQERTVIYDMDLPTISITKPTTAKTFKADGSEEAGAYLNGEVEFTVMLNDKGGSGLDSETNKPKWEIFDASNKTTLLASGFITETTGETISINTAESKYNGKTIIFRVTAWDVAGNKKSTEADDSKYTFIVDQTTDIPFICEDTDYGKVKFSLNSVDAYMAQSAEAKFGTVKKSSTLKFKVYEDDGTANITILKKKLNITKNNDGTYTSDWTNDLSAFDEEEAFEEEIDTPNKLVTMNTYSFPSTDAECGYYEYVIIATDKSDKSASPRNTIKGPFIVRITKDEASITVEKDFDYRNENSEFTNTITIIPSEGPYKLYRQVVVDGEQYNDTSFGDTDIAEYKLIKNNIPDTTLIHEDKLKLSTYAHDKNITVYYKVIDGASQASASQSVVLKYDNAAFAPEIKTPIAGKTGKQALTETTQISARLRDDRAGVEKVFYKFTHNSNPGTEMGTAGGYESEPASNGSFALDLDFVEGLTAGTNQLCEGKWFFHIYTEDGAGNVSAVETREFDIDMKSPVITTTLDDTAISTDAVYNKNAAYTFKFKITETNALDATEPVIISVKKGTTPISFTIKDGTTEVSDLTQIAAGKDYTIEIPDADGLYTYTITVKDFVGKEATVERVVQYDTTPPVAKHEIDTKQKDLYFRIGDYSNDAGVPDVGGKYSGGTYGNALTIQIRGYFDDEGSGINKFYYKTFKDLEVDIDSSIATGNLPVEQGEKIYFKTPDVLKNYVIAKNTGTFFPLDEPEEKNVDYNTAAGKATKAIVSNYKTTIKGFQEGKNYLVLVAEDNVGNTAVDYAEIEGVGKFYCYSLNVDITSPSIPTKEDENLFTNIDSTNTDSNVHFYIEGTVSDKPNKPNGSAGLASVVFTRDGGTGSIELKASDLTEPTTEDISAVPDDSTLKHWKVDVKSLLPSSGTAIISAKVTDNAGYEVSVPVANITVDRTAPEVIINSPVADAKIGATNLIINGTASDGNGAGISSDKLKVYYTKSESLGTATAAPASTDFGTAIAEKWVELGEVTSGAIWTYTKPDINATETIASNNENTSLYFMVSAKDKSGTGNVGYSSPRKVTVDRKAPVFVSGKFNGNETTSTDAWINNRTVNLEGSFTDTHAGVEGSGVTSIFYKFYETGDETSLANAVEKVIPTTDGSYNTNVNLDDSISNASFEIWAKDSAGNVSAKKTYLIKVDYTAPKLSASYYKKGTDSVTATGSTVYIKNQDSGTSFVLYGNYNDGTNQSGVKALVFKKDGTAFTPAVTYSATAIEDGAIPDDSTYAAYNNTAAAGYNSWKATFSLNETARITVEGEDNAGNKATTVSVIDVTFDEQLPELSNIKFTETNSGVTEEVYFSGDKYYINNSAEKGSTFTISGVATDNIGLQSISFDVVNTANTETVLTTPTINNPTGKWSFTVGNWTGWSTGAEVTVKVKDKAGNEDSKILTVEFDTKIPSISEVDLNGESLSANAWYNTQVIPIVVKATDTGSRISSVQYATLKATETNTTIAESKWTSLLSKTEGYTGSATFEDIGQNQKLFIRVTDNAGNVAYYKENNAATLINIDTEAPSVIPYTDNTFSTNGQGEGSISISGTARDAHSGLKNVTVTVEGLDSYSQTVTSFTGTGAEKTWTATIPVSNFENSTSGSYIIYAKATDNAGISNSQVSVGTISVDTKRPTITISSPAADAKVGPADLIITGTASDGTGSGLSSDENDKITLYYTTATPNASNSDNGIIQYTTVSGSTVISGITTGTNIANSWVALDGTLNTAATWTTTKTIPTTVAANNANTDVYFMASVKDNAGNIGYSVPRKITVDRKKPTLKTGTGKINGKTNANAWFNNRTINLSGTFEDDASGIQSVIYKVGNKDDQTLPSNGEYNTNITLDNDVNSTTVKIWAIDKAGNVITSDDEDNYQSYTLKLDTMAPTIDLDYQGIQYSNRNSAYPIAITVSDGASECSGVASVVLSSDAVEETTINCKLEDGKYKAADIRSLLPTSGNATITILATDNAGNSRSKTTTIMVDTKEPIVTLDQPTNAKGTGSETYVNGDISISGTSHDDNIIEVVAGLCYMVDPESAPTKPGKAYITGIDSETEEVIWTAPTGWTKFDEVSMGYGSNTSKWSFQNLETNTNTFNDKTVYFTVAVVDKAGNIGFATPIKVIVDQDTNRPVIKITSMLLDGMTSTNRKGSTESEITGTVSDDDGVPRGLKYSLNGTDFITDGLVYSTSDGSFTLTLEDGEHTIYFEVETNEEISTGVYKKFTTMASPTDAQLVNTPKLTDRNGTTFGEKGTDTNKNTLYYMYIDKDPPEVKDFKYARAYDAEEWGTSISGEYFGGPSSSDLPEGVEAKNTFYITQTAKDANGIKKVYLSIPADANDTNSNAITAWEYKYGSVKKIIYTQGNHPSAAAAYWTDYDVTEENEGSISSVAENNTSVTIGSETYNRTAYIFALEDTEPTKNKKEYHIWRTPENKPVDVTGLASGEKTASLIAYDGTKQTAESKIILVDNSAPTITISAPETVSSSAVVNGSINDGTNTSVTTVSFAVTKTDVTDASTISAESWESESHAGSTQFKITFDGSEEEDSFETHAHLLKQYLINRGILTQNDINTKSAAARQLQPVHVWIRSVDNCNNVGYQKQLVYVDALGNIPTVSIAYPTLNAQDQTLGGTITIMGSSKDNIAPKYVWLQFDIDGDEEWTTADYNLIKDKYTFGNMKSNSDLASGAEVSEDDIADVGIKVDVDGSFSWSKDIDSTDLFSLSSQTANTITMWAYASDDDNGNGTDINVSRPDTRVFNIDKDNPYFKQDTIKLVQYSNQEDPDSPVVRELPYTEAMYIKGIWWIEGEVRDDSAGIREIKKSIFGNNNQYGNDEVLISTTGDQVPTGYYRFTKKVETGENNTTIYNYNFKIKVGDTTTSGRNRFKIKVKENKPGTDARDAEKEFILYYDNIKPAFATPTNSSDGIATEVKNDNGFYGMHSVAYEASANDSGIERVAVYFTRTIGDDTYIFDPMYKRGATVSNNDVSKIKITDSLVQDTTGDKLYWGSATAADTNGLDGVKVTLTAAVPSYVHVGGLAKIDDFVYRIQKISDDKETVTLSSAPNALPSDKKVYFAVANVVDNTKEEKKPASATILKTAYGYGYASNFSEDDSDKIMEYLKNVDSTTWNWNLYINSKNIPDGAITIHYVIFDKAGNTAYNSVDASVENNKPRLVGVTIGRDVNQDGTIATTSPETITYYENGTAAADKPTLYKNGATTITIPNKITVKSKMEVTPEIVGGNGKIYYKIKKKGDSDYVGYGASSAAIELMDGNNAYDNADWDNNKDHTDTSGALVTQSAKITHDLTASNKVKYQALISQNDSAWSLSYMLYDSKEAGEVNKVYINIPEIDFAVYDEDAPSVTITPFYWKQDGDIKKSSALYEDVNNKTVARGHIELKADLSDIDTFNSTGVYDDDDKVSGIIKIEGTATDTRKLSALYISIPGMVTYFGSTKANLTKKTVNSVDYYQISTYSGSAWTDKVGDLANYGFAFQTSDNSLTDTGHTVNWKFTWDTSKISTITAADVNIKVLAEDAASEASTDGNNKTAVGPLKVDVVPYITGISTELSKGNKNYPTVLSRSALGLYPVRRGSDITIEGFNFNGTTTDIVINGTTIVAGKKTEVKVKVEDTEVVDTSKLTVTLDDANLTSGGLVATVGTVSSLNNRTSKTVGYNSEANGQNNDTLTDKRELHFVDVYTTDDKEDKRNLDMAISGNTINFSAGYKDSFFSTMKGASGTSVGTINNLRNSYTRYFDNAIAINESGTIFTVSACGDTLHTPVAKW